VAALRSGGGTLALQDAAVIPGHSYAYVLTARRPGNGELVYLGETIQVVVPPLTVSALVPDYVNGALRFEWRIEGGAMLDYALLRTDLALEVTATAAAARHGDGDLALADPDVLPGRSYSYVLEGHLPATGELVYRGPETFVTVPEEPAISFALALDVRTPARRGDPILFSLPQMGAATLVLHDVRGKRVASMDAGGSGAGWHPFDPGDLKAGVYWLTLVQGGNRITRKMVWLD